MKRYTLILGVVCCSGCSLSMLPYLAQPQTVAEIAAVVDTPLDDGILQPTRNIKELLLQRLSVCSEPADSRKELLEQLPVEANVSNGVNERQLNELIVATCEPARTPGVLNQLLAELTAAGTWPEEYAAFFDLLISGQRAYAAVEKIYVELKQEHEKTIQGLSEIETQIEMQSVNVDP